MRFGFSRVLAGVAVLAGLSLFTRPTAAAPVPVTVDLNTLRAIQTYNLDKKTPDDVYLLVTGVAKGQEVATERFPKSGTWQADPKKLAVSPKQPVTLWKGELNDGEFAQLTVTVFQGKGADTAKTKEYEDKLSAALKGVAPRAGKSLAAAGDVKTLATATLKAEQTMLKDIKQLFSRDKKTDHFSGVFNVLVWNEGGKIVKRLDPVGLLFGENNGTDVKIYTKLKNTRNNVFVQAENGEWSEQPLAPLSDDQTTVRVKMLETEYIKTPERTIRNVTDYLADIQVTASGKPLKWKLGGENPGDDEIHVFWDFAD